jgi:hypothetical protein
MMPSEEECAEFSTNHSSALEAAVEQAVLTHDLEELSRLLRPLIQAVMMPCPSASSFSSDTNSATASTTPSSQNQQQQEVCVVLTLGEHGVVVAEPIAAELAAADGECPLHPPNKHVSLTWIPAVSISMLKHCPGALMTTVDTTAAEEHDAHSHDQTLPPPSPPPPPPPPIQPATNVTGCGDTLAGTALWHLWRHHYHCGSGGGSGGGGAEVGTITTSATAPTSTSSPSSAPSSTTLLVDACAAGAFAATIALVELNAAVPKLLSKPGTAEAISKAPSFLPRIQLP